MELSVLYKQSRVGKTQQWRVWTEGNIICTEYGQKDGKLQIVRKIIEGKNLGKSNETTAEEQADKEALALHTHRLERKYRLTLKETEEVVFLPMLAHDYTKLKKPIQFPVDVQPKLDGVRCMARKVGKKVMLMSRGGKEYDVAHVSEALSIFLRAGHVLDGELYVHGNSLQDTIRLVKKHRDGPEGSETLSYVCYDMFHQTNPGIAWRKRLGLLNKHLGHTRNGGPLPYYICKTEVCNDEKELFEKLMEYEKLGFEGIIIRTLDGAYNLGHRSRDLLKLKNFKDAEFKVIGYDHGSGRDQDAVVWQCETEDGKPFGVRPMGTLAVREEWYINGDDFIGRMLTVKYWALTNDGIPQFPVGLAFREDL